MNIFLSCSKKSPEPQPNPVNTSPTITSLSVNQGVYNTPVTVTGTNFSTTISDDQAFFNGVAATVSSATSTQLKVLVPLGAGTGNVTIKVNSNTATGPVFTYQLSEMVSTFAGNSSGIPVDGKGASAGFYGPVGITMDASGNFYIADNLDNLIRKMTPLAVVTTIAGNSSISGGADGTGNMASFNNPNGVAVDASDNIYVVDFVNSGVRKITPGGVVTTFGGLGSKVGYATDLADASSIIIDKAGNLYVADAIHCLIKKITPAGLVTILAGSGARGSTDGPSASASFNSPAGMAMDAVGNIYVTDNGSMIRKITPAGVVSTFAGSTTRGKSDGTGVAASFNNPWGLAFDKDGNLYVVDSENVLIRKITSTGVVTTFAGSGFAGSNDGAALAASFENPEGICIDGSGNIFITDYKSYLIRKITLE